jgi:peptidylprolyl isomerase
MTITSAELKKRDIRYWTIFIAYSLIVAFYLISFARIVGKEQSMIFTSLTNASATSTMNSIVILKTNLGDISIELFEKESPVTAGNFKKLAEDGFYDGSRFHRVISGFMIQGGDPLSKDTTLKARWGTGGPGYAIEDEFIKGLSNVRGTIAMANSGPNTGGSQFFINLVDNTFLDWDKEPAASKHPVFGKVISGMDVVEKIGDVATEGSDRPVKDVIIEKIMIKAI